MDPFVGEIRLVGFNFAPQGWASCNGQLISIAANTALFSLLGTFYGGNGTTTFALPNLQSRFAIGMGQGTGLSPYVIGQAAGTENSTLTLNNLPAHVHAFALQANTGNASQPSPAGAILAATSDPGGDQFNTYTTQGSNTTLAPQNTSPAGGNIPFPNLPPYLALNYIIALQGIFPSRS